jgi:type II secretory pathway component PulK
LPRQGEAPTAQRHWLGSAQDLVARRLVSGKAMGRVDPKTVTVHSVSPALGPLHFINVNSASPAVLAAVLGVDAARAKAVADARAQKPFATVAELTAAAGQDVPSFNIAGPSTTAGQLPRELSFSSRSFKVCATAELSDGTGKPCAQYLTEAVVVFDDTGKPAVTHWRETSKTQ